VKKAIGSRQQYGKKDYGCTASIASISLALWERARVREAVERNGEKEV